jgi:hypothetical protein
MTYLLDTCVLSKLRKKDSVEAIKLRKWLARHDNSLYFISALTIGELQYGIEKLPKNERLKSALQSGLMGEVIPAFQDRILSIDQQTCSIWGTMNAQAARRGIVLPAVDALIAATAMKHDLIVITQNVKHFRDAEVRLFDPLSE